MVQVAEYGPGIQETKVFEKDAETGHVRFFVYPSVCLAVVRVYLAHKKAPTLQDHRRALRINVL